MGTISHCGESHNCFPLSANCSECSDGETSQQSLGNRSSDVGAGLVYLYFSDYHWFWYLSGRPGKLAGTSDKGIAGAPAKSPPGGAKKATLEDRWEVGRPINPPFSIDGPHLLSDPSVSPLMRALAARGAIDFQMVSS